MRNVIITLLALSSLGYSQLSPKYPSALATDQQLMVGVNNTATYITLAVTSSSTAVVVADATGFIANAEFTFLDTNEIGVVCSVSGLTLTLGLSGVCPSINGRGFDNTVAAAHPAGIPIQVNSTAWHHNGLKNEVEAIETALGVNLVNVNKGHPMAFPIGQPGSGIALTTSNRSGTLRMPIACTILDWSLSLGAGDSGTLTVKLWKIATGTAIPTVSNVINTSGLALSTGTNIRSTTLTDFTTTSVAANDLIIMAITAITGTINSVTGVVNCQ